MPPVGRRRLLLVLDAALAAALAAAAVAALAGGVQVDLGIAVLSIRNVTRPLAVAAVLALARLWAARTAHAAPLNSPPRVALLALILTAIGYWAVFLATVSGGSDSYGYVSASRLLLSGSLVQPQEVAAWLPVPNALDLATPAGYVPSGDRSGIVPLYPLGLPALMAVMTVVFGEIGPYLVTPVTGAVLVILAARVAVAWSDAPTALLAAALVAWNPLVMAYSKQPMSDVPAAMWFMASVWCLVRRAVPSNAGDARRSRGGGAPLLAGVFAGLSFVTRPGGIGALAVLAAMAAAASANRRNALTAFALGCAPLVALQAALQWFLFGSPFSTGYGSLASLYSGQTALENLGIYARGLLLIHTPWWFLAAAAGALAPRRDALWWGLGALLLGGVPYVLYFRFDHWETLRFVLPAVVLLSIAAATGVTWLAGVARRRVAPAGALVTILCAAAFAVRSEAFLRREGAPGLMDSESRYPRTAERVATLTPPAAIVFAAQHSGSLRHYANRTTLRWDLLRPGDLVPVLEAAHARGLAAFVVLEGEEQGRFRERFAQALTTMSMLPVAQIRDVQVWELKLGT